FPIWVVLDPNNQIPEVHKANNRGWANLPVFQSQGGGDEPCSGLGARVPKGVTQVYPLPGQNPDLVLGPNDVNVGSSASLPRAAGAGQRGILSSRGLRLSATVHATGGHFSNVAVTFYDGDPAKGGKYIGHEVIPLIWAGRQATASTDWDTSG